MIDKFGRKIDYLRISVTENCNLKCIYCIDENNILNSCNNDILTDDEIVKIATECARLGIKKIRITGGEPLVRKNIESLIYKLKCINSTMYCLNFSHQGSILRQTDLLLSVRLSFS